MITIAITGGIGAGKSATVEILAKLGARTVNADLLGHAVYESGTAAHSEIVMEFGNAVVGEDGEINRKALGDIVFADESKLRILESIVWPRICEMVEGWKGRCRADGARVIVVEAAVLYEAGWQDLADAVWTVEASYHQRLARIKEKTGMGERAARDRMDAQLAPETRIEKADVVIYNEGDSAALERRVTELWSTITAT